MEITRSSISDMLARKEYRDVYWSQLRVYVKMVVEREVREALEDVRPHLQADGGDLDFVGIEDGVVKVRLKGACAGCPMSQMTLKWGVENYLKKKIPGIKAVEAI